MTERRAGWDRLAREIASGTGSADRQGAASGSGLAQDSGLDSGLGSGLGLSLGLGATLGAGAMAALRYGVQGRSAQMFGRSVYRGPGARKSLALTFDDGPSEGTPRLLEFLAKEGIRATFFQCGLNARRSPRLAREVHRAGHQIGNHTMTHARLCPRLSRRPNLLTPAAIYRELAEAQEVLREVHGTAPTLFRAPYGFRWYGLAEAQRRLGLLGVMWTVIGHDWEWGAAAIAEHVGTGAAPGGIVCLHDGRDTQQTVDLSELLAALGRLVPEWKAEGYSFETVSELLRPDA